MVKFFYGPAGVYPNVLVWYKTGVKALVATILPVRAGKESDQESTARMADLNELVDYELVVERDLAIVHALPAH